MAVGDSEKILMEQILPQIKEVAKEAIENGEAVVRAPDIIVSATERRKIIEEWFNPENQFSLKKISEKLAIPEEIVSVVVGLHPDVREAEEARHRANLYSLRRKLDAMLDKTVELVNNLAGSKSSKDWDLALTHIRKLITSIDAYLSEEVEVSEELSAIFELDDADI